MVNLIYRCFKVNPLLRQCEYIAVANLIYCYFKANILLWKSKFIIVEVWVYCHGKTNLLLWHSKSIIMANRIHFLKKVHILLRQYKSIVVRKWMDYYVMPLLYWVISPYTIKKFFCVLCQFTDRINSHVVLIGSGCSA